MTSVDVVSMQGSSSRLMLPSSFPTVLHRKYRKICMFEDDVRFGVGLGDPSDLDHSISLFRTLCSLLD